MAPSLVKYNWMFPWDQTANGFQFLKSPTQFPEEPKKTAGRFDRTCRFAFLFAINNKPELGFAATTDLS